MKGKKIILGITGGIAAYKTPILVRLLVRAGHEVRVVMTPAAESFVTPQTLATVSGHEVWTGFFGEGHRWLNHVKLAEWADLMVIAPLTANTLAKMAAGACDNILLATWLSARSETIMAPAMDLEMYRQPAVRQNIEKLASNGHIIMPASTGPLASGLEGEGRMPEPEEIAAFIQRHFNKDLPFSGMKALVNAGPTHEPIDPVRFIGNRSSGKMGIAIAECLAGSGADVTLVVGPTNEKIPPGIRVIRVETAQEMHEQTIAHASESRVIVCAAAVADYRPAEPGTSKLKKSAANMELALVRNPDILGDLAGMSLKAFVVGFALETDNVLEHAREKLAKKKLDMIVANSPGKDSGFGTDTNRITIIDKHNKITNFGLKSKRDAAQDIVNHIASGIANP